MARRRVITRKGGVATQTLLTSSKDHLIEEVSRQYASIDTVNATVDMAPALGTANKGKITEYKDVRAYILYRKPSDIRLIGLYPVVRNKAFDMVSNGARFRLYIPARNRFIEGPNQMEKPSENKLENLRPQHFLEALLARPIDTTREQTVLENLTDEDNAVYILSVLHQDGNTLLLDRQLWFDRLKLQLVRQLLFDAAGDILTDARYSDWQTYDGVPFPKRIDIDRPQDEYGVVITAVKVDINKPITDDKFDLPQPPGTELKQSGSDQTAAAPAEKEGPAKK